MISQPRRNSLVQNILSRFASDHERCKRDGHRWVFGHCRLPERRESLHFSTCTAPAVRPLVPSSARGSDSGPRRFSDERTVPRCRLAAAFQSTECAAKSRCRLLAFQHKKRPASLPTRSWVQHNPWEIGMPHSLPLEVYSPPYLRRTPLAGVATGFNFRPDQRYLLFPEQPR